MLGVVTAKEAARQLGVTSGRVRQLVLAGRIPAQKVAHVTVITTKDLADYKTAVLRKKKAQARRVKQLNKQLNGNR